MALRRLSVLAGRFHSRQSIVCTGSLEERIVFILGRNVCCWGFRTVRKSGQRSSEVEQLFRKQQVDGSIPSVGSIHSPHCHALRGFAHGIADIAYIAILPTNY